MQVNDERRQAGKHQDKADGSRRIQDNSEVKIILKRYSQAKTKQDNPTTRHQHDKTRQDKTRQDKARQDKTRQDKTRHEETR